MGTKYAPEPAPKAETNYPKAQGRDWYTKYRSQDDTVHLMLNKAGEVTTSYPHVHVIHDSGKEIRILLSRSQEDHPYQMVLPATASGNEVNAAIEDMLRKL